MSTRGADGWVLLEVMAAVVVFAILIASLAAGFLAVIERGAGTERQADRLSPGELQGESAWTWGDRALEAAWMPGPTLNLRVATAGPISDTVVGVWTDGWLLAQVSPVENGWVNLGASIWTDRDGQELVIRVRQGDGPWGPPWRSIVPDLTGIAVGPAGGVVTGSAGGAATVHPPFAANPRFDMDGSSGEIVAGPSGSPFFATLIPTGPAAVMLDGAERQSWLSEPGRGLDVYF